MGHLMRPRRALSCPYRDAPCRLRQIYMKGHDHGSWTDHPQAPARGRPSAAA